MADKLTEAQLSELKKAFSKFDINGDGTISRTEIAAVIRDGGEKVSEEELNEAMVKYDLDGNGSIDFAEFLVLITDVLSESD